MAKGVSRIFHWGAKTEVPKIEPKAESGVGFFKTPPHQLNIIVSGEVLTLYYC